jgi:WhiB family redox-sensing transcriptional regulator
MKAIYDDGRCVASGQNDLFFSERPDELAQAQSICMECMVRLDCLEVALERKEAWGVWGGVIFWDGRPYHRRRGRGRPRRIEQGLELEADVNELWRQVRSA